MEAAEIRGVLERHLAAEAEHDPAAAAATYLEDGYYENCALGLRFEGRAGVELQYAASYETIREMAATYLFEHIEGNTVLQLGRITGVAADSILGVPTAGGRLDFPFTALISFRNGGMAGEQIVYDLDTFCAQAGADLAPVRAAAASMRAAMAGELP